jgi:hypothetical protein
MTPYMLHSCPLDLAIERYISLSLCVLAIISSSSYVVGMRGSCRLLPISLPFPRIGGPGLRKDS